MKEETKKALDKSIEHWEAIVAMVADAKPTSSQCRLCKVFNSDPIRPCINDEGEKCPIYLATGKALCINTPYQKVYDNWYIGGIYEEDAKEMLELLEQIRKEVS